MATEREYKHLPLKTVGEIAAMREAGLLTWQCHRAAAEMIRPGITTGEINERIEGLIADYGADALFKGVPGVTPFPAAACISVNEEVVHGIPGSRRLAEGDIVGIDIGVRVDGWCADAAETHCVGEVAPGVAELVAVTSEVLEIAIEGLNFLDTWQEVANSMQDYIEGFGFSVVTQFGGHGIGREVWEDPEVPNAWEAYCKDFWLEPGLVIAIEPMLNMGTPKVETLDDHWTVVTTDRRPSAHFEHTVAMTENGPMVLTAGPDEAWRFAE